MDKVPTLPVNCDVGDALKMDPMKVYCMPLESMVVPILSGGNQFADNVCVEESERYSPRSNKAVRWDNVTTQAESVLQPMKIELPLGFSGITRLPQNLSGSNLLSPNCNSFSGAVRMRKEDTTTMMRLGLATPKSTTMKQDFFETYGPSSLPLLPRGKNVCAEELSTEISGSDSDRLTILNSEDDSPPNCKQQQFGRAVSHDMTNQSESVPALNAEQQIPPGIPTVGSALHGTGMCKPCAWFWKPSGCRNEGECRHCHLCPQGELKAQKRDKKIMMRLGLATPKSIVASEKNKSKFPPFEFHMPANFAA